MRILNAFAGIGGNRLGFQRWAERTGTAISVTAVELDGMVAREYQHHFPADEMVVGDAWDYVAQNYDSFDFIWASPPCQSHSKLNVPLHVQGKVRRLPDFRLHALVVYLRTWARDQKWVVENVVPYYGHFIRPSAVVGRHAFWSNFHIRETEVRREYAVHNDSLSKMERNIGLTLSGAWKRSGIRSRQLLRNCVMPSIAEHILSCAMGGNGNLEEWI